MADGLPGQDAPVETPVAAEATTTPETTAVPEAETKPEQPERTFTQKELDEIVAKRAAQAERRAMKVARAEAERDHYRRLAEEAQQRTQPQRAGDGRPREEDFAGKPYSEYVEALSEWKAKSLLDQTLRAREQEQTQRRQQETAAESAQRIKERLSEGADEYPDFEEVALADHVPISPAMAHAIASSDAPAKVAYYLGSHLDEAKRIFGLPPEKQFREVVKLESKLSEPPPTTKAPPPIKPSGSKASGDIDPDKLSPDEWRKWREAQLRAQRR